MAHFAELDENNIVVRVIVVPDREEANGEAYCNALLGGTWKQTSYNTQENVHKLGGTPLRKNFAGHGYKYNSEIDGFVPPCEYASWVLNTTKGIYEAPVPYPDDGNSYAWDEETTNWVQR